jgi:hypothetical protein
MKGVILSCLASMVKDKFGEEKWALAMQDAGLARTAIFLAHEDVADAQAVRILGSVCKVLDIDLQQAGDAFGDYWVNTFTPNIYPAYYLGVTNAREFLLKMDKVHIMTTQSIPNAHPPRFDYNWKDDRTLIMTYRSERGLMDLFVGLIKGVGKRYGENLAIQVLDKSRVEIVFAR